MRIKERLMRLSQRCVTADPGCIANRAEKRIRDGTIKIIPEKRISTKTDRWIGG